MCDWQEEKNSRRAEEAIEIFEMKCIPRQKEKEYTIYDYYKIIILYMLWSMGKFPL